jgi:hypothetical protein
MNTTMCSTSRIVPVPRAADRFGEGVERDGGARGLCDGMQETAAAR